MVSFKRIFMRNIVKSCFLAFMLIFSNQLMAQTERPADKLAVNQFQQKYNDNDYEGIFAMFDADMQKAVPLKETKEFLTAMKSNAGKIKQTSFQSYKQGFAVYKMEGEKSTLALLIAANEKGKIIGFTVEAFEEKKEEKPTINALTSIDKEQAKIIFDKAKNFPNKTQLSFAFIENEKVCYYGVIKENDSLKTIDNKENIFEIGSISKVFTATLLANAVLEKKIKLDDDINKFYDFPFKNNAKIDFKSLSNHTSGLPRLPTNLDFEKVNPDNPYKEYDETKLNFYLKNELAQSQTTREKSEYSNLGAGILGFTLGKVQKSSYEKLLNEKIFKKYKMTSSFVNNKLVKNRLVKGLDESGKEVSHWDFDVLAGGGAILSNVTDLSKFVNAQFQATNKELALTRVSTFTVNERLKMGLGWHIIKTKAGKDIYFHNGGTGGYSSSMAINMENKNSVIILSNVSGLSPIHGNITQISLELLESLERK